VIAPPILAMLNTMLRETLVSGTGKKAELPGWEAAGKTGTSQDFRDAWFIGYAPADNPKVAVAVVIEESSGTGGQVAAPIAGQVIRTALNAGPVQGDPQP
jgi:penicillin-binding protein 1A